MTVKLHECRRYQETDAVYPRCPPVSPSGATKETLRHALESVKCYDENAASRPFPAPRRPLRRIQTNRTPRHQTEGNVPMATRLRVAVHGSRIGSRYIVCYLGYGTQ
jgi:hypothetical protein